MQLPIGIDGWLECPGCGKTNTLSVAREILMVEEIIDLHIVCRYCKRIFYLLMHSPNTGGVHIEIDKTFTETKIDYRKYIQSPEWKEKADAAKERAGRHCQLCNGDGKLHTHHRTYERLGNELPDDLIVLCAGCHAKFHNKEPL